MKRLFLLTILSAFIATTSFAGNYRLDEQAIDDAFAQSENITYTVDAATMLSAAMADEAPTKVGFLVRSYFCGFIALHRSYMGTGGASLWWKYLCIPVVGSVANCVDFWGVVFKGDEQLAKYKDNSAFLVWKN